MVVAEPVAAVVEGWRWPGGGGGTGGGGKTGGGTTGGRTGSGTAGTMSNNNLYNPYNQPRQIVPPFPPSASDNQQVLYQLADGTGGFVILNTNDLLGGLERIAKDQNQYYLLGYKPAVSVEGSCHTLKVKVERGGTNVRARSGYCNVQAGRSPGRESDREGPGNPRRRRDARAMLPLSCRRLSSTLRPTRLRFISPSRFLQRRSNSKK